MCIRDSSSDKGNDRHRQDNRKKTMDGLTFLAIALIWVVLQFWLLPKFGIT